MKQRKRYCTPIVSANLESQAKIIHEAKCYKLNRSQGLPHGHLPCCFNLQPPTVENSRRLLRFPKL